MFTTFFSLREVRSFVLWYFVPSLERVFCNYQLFVNVDFYSSSFVFHACQVLVRLLFCFACDPIHVLSFQFRFSDCPSWPFQYRLFPWLCFILRFFLVRSSFVCFFCSEISCFVLSPFQSNGFLYFYLYLNCLQSSFFLLIFSLNI